MRRRVAILISGRGSNMAALIEAARRPDYPAEIALVISNRPGAPGLERASEAGIATRIVDHTAYGSREAFDTALDAILREAEIELVCLAGFMRILGDEFVAAWRDRVINIHPSLLPALPGLDTHARALAAGARIHGCTVHFLRPELDSGPVIAQAAVPILPSDDAETLAARVLRAEHRIYPMALALVASGRARVTENRVLIEGEEAEETTLFVPSPLAD